MRQIPLSNIEGFRIGQVEDAQAATGATVIVCERGMAAGLDVRGGGPASRDSRILDPLAAADAVHAVVLAGGSAFGLDAAGGVQRFLEERGVGLDVGDVHVPLVCQSNIFDLLLGASDVRPDAAMGYAACEAAFQGEAGNYRDGNLGAGCGATVGKVAGGAFCMKAGVGSHAVQLGDLKLGAVVVLNAVGNVRDLQTGTFVAGVRTEDGRGIRDAAQLMYAAYEDAPGARAQERARATEPGMATNTTIGAVLTNAALSKAQLCKVAGMAHDGYARAICPVHTSVDGDSIYALSTGGAEAPLDVVGTLAADVMAQAIVNAASNAEAAYGLPCASDLAAQKGA